MVKMVKKEPPESSKHLVASKKKGFRGFMHGPASSTNSGKDLVGANYDSSVDDTKRKPSVGSAESSLFITKSNFFNNSKTMRMHPINTNAAPITIEDRANSLKQGVNEITEDADEKEATQEPKIEKIEKIDKKNNIIAAVRKKGTMVQKKMKKSLTIK